MSHTASKTRFFNNASASIFLSSPFMQSFSTAHTVYYNLRHRRHGHLPAGRYKAKLVERADERADRLRQSMSKPQGGIEGSK